MFVFTAVNTYTCKFFPCVSAIEVTAIVIRCAVHVDHIYREADNICSLFHVENETKCKSFKPADLVTCPDNVWEVLLQADCHSHGQGTSRLAWNLKVRCQGYNILPLDAA
jgi:hypothetical protein